MVRLSRVESARLTREKLLSAAEEVFAERGFEAATLEEVATRAGFTRGALYANFDGKSSLFLALLDRWLEDHEAWFDEHEATEPSVRQLIEALQQLPGNNYADRRQYMLVTEFRLHALRNPELLPRLSAHEGRIRQWYARAVSAVSARSGLEVGEEEAQRLGLLVSCLEYGVASLAHIDEVIPHQTFVTLLTDLARLSANR